MNPVDQVRSVEPVGLRAVVRAQVLTRRPIDERERTSLEHALEALDRLPAPFSEIADPTHVTGSAIVIGRRGVVLHRHRRLGIWLQPGGHVDPGETPWVAARREAAEETGLPVTFADPVAGGDGNPPLAHVDVHPGPRGHTHVDLRYLFEAADVDPDPRPGESQEVAWFGWNDAIAVADPGLRSALESLRPH